MTHAAAPNPPAEPAAPPGLRRFEFALPGALVVADQFTKWLVATRLELHESHPLIDGFLALTHVRNRGAAFGLAAEADLPHQGLLFAGLSVIALVAIAWYARRLPRNQRLARTALVLVMGGAVGNLLDRVRLGYVVDFIDASWGPHHWPAFNLADAAISVGVALLLLDILRSPHGQARPQDHGGRAASPLAE